MAELRDFTCRACGAQFDRRDQLDKHNRREHSVSQADGAGSGDRKPGQQGSQQDEAAQSGRGRSEPRDEDYTG